MIENSVNTNESSGIDSEDKKQSENNNIENNKEKEVKEKNEENKEIKDNDKEKIKEKKENEEDIKKKDEQIEENIDKERKDHENEIIKEDNDDNKKEDKIDRAIEKSENEIQYNNTLLKNVEKYNIKKMQDNYDKEDAKFKVLFLGDCGVGKSSLVIRAITNNYDSFYKPTVGFDLLNYIVKINDKIIKLQIWDTCGQEEFSMCNQSLFKNTSIAVMIYSINSKKTYDNIKKWITCVKNLSNEDTILFLVGNKSDLSNQRQISFTEAKNNGESNFKFFVETSSKFGYNVDLLFKEIVIYLYENNLKNKSVDDYNNSKEEDFLSREQSSSFLDSQNIYLHNNKKCLKCC